MLLFELLSIFDDSEDKRVQIKSNLICSQEKYLRLQILSSSKTLK